MSLTAHSPSVGHKRLLSDTDSPDHSPHYTKRTRHTQKVRPSRCSRRPAQAYEDKDFLCATLKSLFPHMDDTAVVNVLESCGHDIDEAIRQLGQLNLTQAQASALASGRSSDKDAKVPAEAANSREASGAGKLDGTDEREADVIRTPAEWIEGLVQQMASAKDLADARTRAAGELRSFEQAVMRTTNKARAADVQAAQGKATELNKENALLKRAVNILQTRLQDAANVNKQQAQQAEAVVSQLQEKVQKLEMANYSLQLHIKEAIDSRHSHHHHHPDIF